MSRWELDGVLYRVLFVTLVGVAVTFTVILTDVFLDIDGMLADNRVTLKPPASISHDLSELSRVINVNMLPDDRSEEIYDDKDYQDSNDLYRSKRSLETSDRIFHIKDPKVKKLLTSHLSNLLDELDERDKKLIQKVPSHDIDNKIDKTNVENINNKPKSKHTSDSILEIVTDKQKTKIKEEKLSKVIEKEESTRDLEENEPHKDFKTELLHLAMHNIILQGIIDNTDLDEVYKKVAELVKDFENDQSKPKKNELKNMFKNMRSSDKRAGFSNTKTLDDTENYNGFKKRSTDKEATTEFNTIHRTTTRKPKDHNIIIKTTIDITAISNDKANNEGDLNGKDKINGVIKLIYNGNTIKFKRVDDENINNNEKGFDKLNNKEFHSTNLQNNSHNFSNQSYYQKILYDYLKKLKVPNGPQQELSVQEMLSSKRLKRHVKIRYENNKTTVKPKTKKEDDELFVEIETHFDSKGTKGEKKKKLVRDLIQKIQNAIHSDNNGHGQTKKKQKHWHVKKRIQDPLSRNTAALINKLILPLESLAHRQLDPISKAVPIHEQLPLITNVFGYNHWDKPYASPRFLGKNINSAEMNTLDTDYNKVMRHNGIPQRLQKPLNTEISDEVFQDSKVVDLGNVKFLMKDINGTGFSIGFNQYTDEAPDTETMKLFSGLENIIQSYHQQYDQESIIGTRPQSNLDNVENISPESLIANEEQRGKYDQHVIQRRSIKNFSENNHRNNYRIVYGHNIIPHKDLNNLVNFSKSKSTKTKKIKLYKMKNADKTAFIIDENVFEKNLKPSEILSIADLLQRKKREIKLKKRSNIKIKSNIKYLNPKGMATRSIFLNKKQTRRTKRQIEKIRIIARDLPQNEKSEEENVFVVSDEKLFADRALVREVEVPELEQSEKMPSIEHEEVLVPEREEPFEAISQAQKGNDEHDDQYDILSPYLYDVNLFNNQNEFNRRARHNSLMSKYPHIIMEDSPNYMNNGQDFALDNVQPQPFDLEATTILPSIPTILDIASPSEQEITELISPPKDHSNYRVSVKIRPKNSTNMSGFKEVHTSINKSYNRNGLTYTSLVNVSQLSKVEKVNKTISRRENHDTTAMEEKVNLKQQQDLIKSLIQQHKHRLDVQLKHIQFEKQKLEAMNADDNLENVAEIKQSKVNQPKVDQIKNHPPNPKRITKLNKNEEKIKLTPRTTTTASTTTIFTTEPTTIEALETTTDDAIKRKMIETIEKNENITNELLKKIDQNTGVLKIFLGKLIATLDAPSKRATDMKTSKPEEDNQNTGNIKESNVVTKQSVKDANVENHMPFNFENYPFMSNILFRNMPRSTNNSYGIPFVYAVQHPFKGNLKKDHLTSLVYQGHIHTNPVNENMKKDINIKPISMLKDKIIVPQQKIDPEFWNPKPGEKVLNDFVVSKNNTRFFLDETSSDLTAVPVDTGKSIYPLTFNGTDI